MKLSTISLFLLGALVFFASCAQQDHKQASQPYFIDSSLLVPAALAKEDIADFDSIATITLNGNNIHKSLSTQIPVKAFTIRAEDLLLAMGISDYINIDACNDIRVYMGFNEPENQFKLYVVPVVFGSHATEAGRDAFLNNKGDIANLLPCSTDSTTGLYVLDLNAPCPNLCDACTPLIAN